MPGPSANFAKVTNASRRSFTFDEKSDDLFNGAGCTHGFHPAQCIKVPPQLGLVRILRHFAVPLSIRSAKPR